MTFYVEFGLKWSLTIVDPITDRDIGNHSQGKIILVIQDQFFLFLITHFFGSSSMRLKLLVYTIQAIVHFQMRCLWRNVQFSYWLSGHERRLPTINASSRYNEQTSGHIIIDHPSMSGSAKSQINVCCRVLLVCLIYITKLGYEDCSQRKEQILVMPYCSK